MQRRNKRKSLEPKKLNVSVGGGALEPTAEGGRVSLEANTPMKRQRLGSTGSDERSSLQNSMSPGSSHNEIHSSRSPSPTSNPECSLAPKMRYKQTAAKAALISKQQQPKTERGHEPGNKRPSNPFRPWDNDEGPADEPGSAATDARPSSGPIRASPILALPNYPVIPPVSPMRQVPDYQSSLASLFLTNPTLRGSIPAELSSLSPIMPLLVPPTTYTPAPAPPPVQDEPLALVKHKREGESPEPSSFQPIVASENRTASWKRDAFTSALAAHLAPVSTAGLQPRSWHDKAMSSQGSDSGLNQSNDRGPSPSGSSDPSPSSGKGKQRNYKNMTRERRVEANARERQRVHTITAAFDTLQNAIPTEDSSQKLSKLSIIKIATSYIMVLSRMAGYDYSIDQSAPSVEDCIEKCSDLIYSESKVRKKTSSNRDSD
ncbi:hypothetical protein TCAL_09373 [Tigriopus californicus]|uniref:BHLH domain-containing protein n=1 Tax=Tigriopus californicus TaxID=6832 RepID=A0A553PSP9_TIGCA|nr:transcription factor ATOH8-like [Tigriopus californicus]TRY80701.1 hypothetical protein TCAL_09373 [Tigriopus californicus]|eukprot:TCALIF_09373-PA protein Name:"Similar to Atoh8 Protein atonal homolog 8 (Mus musculus)" AED:0.12 eAED:0.42 QI:0/-1/0/1/-1/1/1/0/431